MDLAAIVAADGDLQRIVDAWPELTADDQRTIARIVALAVSEKTHDELGSALAMTKANQPQQPPQQRQVTA